MTAARAPRVDLLIAYGRPAAQPGQEAQGAGAVCKFSAATKPIATFIPKRNFRLPTRSFYFLRGRAHSAHHVSRPQGRAGDGTRDETTPLLFREQERKQPGAC